MGCIVPPPYFVLERYMFRNVSGVRQSVKNFIGDYTPIMPNEVVSGKVYSCLPQLPSFVKVKKLDFKNVKTILLKRSHALGDVVMTFPIVNYLKSIGKDVSVNTGTRYNIDGVDFLYSRPNIHTDTYDLVIDMNLVVEVDHYYPEYYKVHRVDIYKEYLNLSNIGNDWCVDFNCTDVDIDGAIIGIQLKGSAKCKTVDLTDVLDRLEQDDIKFFIISSDLSLDLSKYKNAVIRPQNLAGLLSVFRKLKGVLCFDSGPFWFSHVTATPAFVICGPTSGPKLLKRHPNSKSCYYDTKKDSGCSLKHGCGESMSNCKGFDCMVNVDKKRLVKELYKWIERL